MGADLRMYAKNYNVEFNSNSFPINTLNLMRERLQQKLDIFEKYSDTIFKGIWVKDLNLGDLEVLKDYLEKSGIQADEVFKLCQDREIKNELITILKKLYLKEYLELLLL